MALRNAHEGGFLRPNNFKKPPFHTYLAQVVRIPVRVTLTDWRTAELLGCRLLTVGLFLSSVWALFLTVLDTVGRQAARWTSLLYATCAGPVAFSHFLTCDMPLTAMMVWVLFLAQRLLLRGTRSDYILCGLLVGVCTATKYNGLAVGALLPLAHLLAGRSLFSRKLWLGLLAIGLGFVVANPYSVIEPQRFASDFLYNSKTTPVYDGNTSGTSYLQMPGRLTELMGVPLFLFSLVSIVASAVWSEKRTLTWLSLGLLVPYVLLFGAFPRCPTRFLLPLVPFLLAAGAPFYSKLKRRWIPLLTLLLAYNVVCSLLVGWRFCSDPRTAAQEWAVVHFQPGQVIESGDYAPRWELLPELAVRDVRMAPMRGKKAIFEKIFQDDKSFKYRGPDPVPEWYTPRALSERSPDFVVIDSLHYDRFFRGAHQQNYPQVGEFFRALLSGQLGYEVVFEGSTPRPPWWAYPRRLLFLDNRLTILKRSKS